MRERTEAERERGRRAANLWTARIIPIVLAGVVGYATYVTVALLCVNYLLVKHNDKRAAIPILVVYFILFILMTSSFLRVTYTTTFDPAYLPLGPDAKRKQNTRKGKTKATKDFAAGEEYTSGESAHSKDDPDSPGLENFYTKDVFVAEMDGRPRWCTECANWKPDRTHHCSASGRCIYKMDHYCPWVGGPVGENNFKFFIQFNAYTALYCINILVSMAIYVHQQITTEGESVNAQFAVIIGLAGFFGTFTGSMTITTISLAFRNLTQVEVLNIKTKRHILAILKPSFDQSNSINPDSASTVSYPEITYPLAPTPPVSSNRPVTNVDHPQEAQPTANADNTPPANETLDELLESSAGNTTVPSSVPSEALPTETEERSLVGQPGAPRLHSSQDPLWPRDTRATRTFAILKMSEPGQNPWDLGSPLLNWETVMGTSIIHWFLPIERSPCCSHEDSESHFLVGPAVDRLRADFSLIKKEDVRKRGRQRSDSKYSESPGRRDKILGRLTNTTELKDLNGQTSRLEHQ